MVKVITRVNVHAQHGDKVFTFSLTAEEVMALCRVERFGFDPEGVNRKLDNDHALRISEAMLDHDILWLEPILGDLAGGKWRYDERENSLVGNDDAYVSIDDGQHRWHALSLLNPLERVHLSFTVSATMGLPFERRLKIFRMQKNRKPLDSRLDLAQRHRLNDWKNAADREAYELVLKLNADTTSPLKGMVVLEEQSKRPYEGRHRPVGINAKGLHATLRSVLGTSSPLSALSPEQRSRVVLTLIQLAADMWPSEWKSDQHVLTTARGINAILMLVVSSPNFRGAIGDNFSQESLRQGLAWAQSFKWTTSSLRNVSVREIVVRLDQSIGRNKRGKGQRAAA